MAALVKIFDAQSWVIDQADGPRRQPARPPERQTEAFRKAFDDRTLIFDVARSVDGRRAVILAPPPANLLGIFEGARFTALPGGEALPAAHLHGEKHFQLSLAIPEGAEAIRMDCELGSRAFAVRDDCHAFFEGRRVVVCLTRNNHLVWVRDWATYYQKVHGADGILLFDNASDAYAPEALSDAASVPGISRVAVVRWPFPYGPPVRSPLDAWDADFCQCGMLETARHRFLGRARSVLNVDIDELVVSDDGGSIFALAERRGFVCFERLWSEIVSGAGDRAASPPGSLTRFSDFRFSVRPARARTSLRKPLAFLRPAGAGGRKWALAPARVPRTSQWCLHWLHLRPPVSPVLWLRCHLPARGMTARHFRQINTGWYYERSAPSAFDPEQHFRDEAMIAALARAFGSPAAHGPDPIRTEN